MARTVGCLRMRLVTGGGSAFIGKHGKRCELLVLVDDHFDKTEKLDVNGIKGRF